MKKIIFLLITMLFANIVNAADFNVYKLDNGQTVVIQEVKTNPIVTIDTWIKTGSINENDQNNGVSHFLEHLFFKGSTNHAPGEFDKILENFKINKSVTFVLADIDKDILRAANNIPNVKVTYADVLNTYDIVASNKVFFTKDAIKKVEEAYK